MSDNSSEIDLRITGMSCGGCSGRVASALASEPGVLEVQVDLDGGSARVLVEKTGPSAARLSEIVEELGYECDNCMGDARDRGAPQKLKKR
jgi:copper chaperone